MSGSHCCENLAMLSAREGMCVAGCVGMGRSCLKRLKRVGGNIDPCGTPFCKCLLVDSMMLSEV